MKRDDRKPQFDRPTNASVLAFVGTTWIALVPLIVWWNIQLESSEPGVGIGILSTLAVLALPVVGWAFAKNISELGVEHAQRPAFAAAILVSCIWAGGVHVHLTGALWLSKCVGVQDADSCLAAGNYFDSGEAAFQGTIDAKELWADACEGGGEHGWKACRKIVHRVGYRTLACKSLKDHCHADDRNMGACWDWSVVCNREAFVDEEVDEAAKSALETPSKTNSKLRIPGRAEQLADFDACLAGRGRGVSPECDRTLDRGILSQRERVCEKIDHDCDDVRSWSCSFANSRCELLAANPFE